MLYRYPSFLLTLCAFWGLCCFTTAQTVQSILWKVPDGTLSDLSQQFTTGNTLPLSWNAWNSDQYVDATKNLVDLWATSFDYSLNAFSQRLAKNLNLTTAGNFAWTIQVPDTSLAISAKYVLRFKAAASSLEIDSGELSSPGFIILRAIISTTSTPDTRTSSVATSSNPVTSSFSGSTLASPTPLNPTATPVSQQTSGSGGLTTGAKIGIGLGVSLGILVLCVLAYILFKRKGTKYSPPTDISQIEEADYKKYGSTPNPAELAGLSQGPSELEATREPASHK
ncbi:hypothetical protein BKA64DRAFT_720727 [Cadophora sp. MPI-SDFR-AT-0126]|nr:hypothetical protein BKA64DRAFT_720727 [Leotiomycetes sp. MPI-SDFR-AT-0126]